MTVISVYEDRWASPITVLVCATTFIRVVFATTTGLGVDESYMIAAGRVLSLGYFDHPPASWWLSRASADLFGTEAPIVVRLPFILLFAISQILLWRIGCLVANRRASFWAVVALNLSPVFGVTTGCWVLPDGPLDAALLGAALCLLKAVAEDDHHVVWWCGTGLCAGLALFSKYTAVLSIAGALFYLLTSQRHRFWLRRWEPYAAATIALLVFSPVLVWNAQHGWASFAFQSDRATGLHFHLLAPLVTFGGEALFILPWIWLPMMLLLVRGFARNAFWTHRLMVCLASPAIIGFVLISAWSSQRTLFHWAAPGYLMLFPALGEAIANRVRMRWVRHLIVYTSILVIFFASMVGLQIQFDWLGSSLAAVMRRDPTDEGLDWISVRDDMQTRGLLHSGLVAASLNWRDAGKFGYALGPDTIMLCLSNDSREFGQVSPASAFTDRDVILLLLDPVGRNVDEARRWFGRVEILAAVSVRLRGRVLRTVTVIQGQGLHVPQ